MATWIVTYYVFLDNFEDVKELDTMCIQEFAVL